MQNDHDYDVLITGAGLVGASFACALMGSGLQVAIIETRRPDPAALSPDNARLLGLALASQRIFNGLGIWSELESFATPIAQVQVSDRGHFGKTRLRASELGLPALGYVVPSNELLGSLWTRLQTSDIDLIAPATVASVAVSESSATVVVDTQDGTRTLSARLLVAADGAQSSVRRQLGVLETEHDYHQSAIVTSVQTEHAHANVAFERFTGEGPLALLPFRDRMALIWTVAASEVDALAALSDEEFLGRVQTLFGARLGKFRALSARKFHPLKMINADSAPAQRAVVIGNAAQTLHPVASQGFNLGLRDVAWLAQLIVDVQVAGQDPGAASVLAMYQREREHDTRRVKAFSSNLVSLFGSDRLPVIVGRNLAMFALQALPPLRHRLMLAGMGLAGRLPRLARGLPL